MKQIKNFINESVDANDPVTIVSLTISSFIDTHKDLDGEDLKKEMEFIRTYLSNVQHDLNIRFDKIEKFLQIPKAYPDRKTNIEQWILSKIAKKPEKK